MKIIYTGWFVCKNELFDVVKNFAPQRLEQIVESPHVTLAFRPSFVNTALFGSTAEITITGYGNDGINEGLCVTVDSDEDELAAQLRSLDKPHLTLSVSRDGNPIHTANLDFRPVPSHTITGIFGAFTSEDIVVLSPLQDD